MFGFDFIVPLFPPKLDLFFIRVSLIMAAGFCCESYITLFRLTWLEMGFLNFGSETFSQILEARR